MKKLKSKIINLITNYRLPITDYRLLILACCLLFTAYSFANTNYVGTAGVAAGSYFTDIQSAVDATLENGLVLVSNGVYDTGGNLIIYSGNATNSLTNRVVMLTNITIRSISGPQSTIIVGGEGINGAQGTGAVRCVFMNAGILSGFTLSNGYTLVHGEETYDKSGGGVLFEVFGVVTNCIITGCSAGDKIGIGGGGGGVCFFYGGTIDDCTIINNGSNLGGGAFIQYGGTIKNSILLNNSGDLGGGVRMHAGEVSDCIITGNYAKGYGAGIDGYDCIVRNCLIANNSTDMSSGNGGGIHCFMNMYVVDCSIIGNSAEDGGGIKCYVSVGYKGSIFSNCVISANLAGDYGGGVFFGSDSELLNCLVNDNFSSNRAGGVSFWFGGIIKNCTVVSNSTVNEGGGVYCNTQGSNLNSIIYFNTADSGTNYYNDGTDMVYEYSCIFPQITNGVGNISADPQFVSSISNNWRLQPTSPCINAGTNAYAPIPWDLDDNPRIIGGRVDMGAYELIPEPVCVLIFGILILFYQKIKLKL